MIDKKNHIFDIFQQIKNTAKACHQFFLFLITCCLLYYYWLFLKNNFELLNKLSSQTLFENYQINNLEALLNENPSHTKKKIAIELKL